MMFPRFACSGIAASVALFMLLVMGVPSVSALDVPPKPVDIPIVDQTGTLSEEQKTTLAKQISDERSKSGNQVAIVIVPSLENDSIEDYSLKIAREWGIGTSENNNGVLLLIAKNDRQLRIEVGSGLEGALTDVQSGRIIRDDITPLFKQSKYFEGTQAGLTSIIASINSEYESSATADTKRFPWELTSLMFVVALSWLGSILARTKSWWAGGLVGGGLGGLAGIVLGSLLTGILGAVVLALAGLLFDKVVSANYRSRASRGETPSWWAGGGVLGGGGSDGGFGGGGFSGGGSSGSW